MSQNLVSCLVLLDWNSEGGDYEVYCLLSCDALQVLVVWLQSFGGNFWLHLLGRYPFVCKWCGLISVCDDAEWRAAILMPPDGDISTKRMRISLQSRARRSHATQVKGKQSFQNQDKRKSGQICAWRSLYR